MHPSGTATAVARADAVDPGVARRPGGGPDPLDDLAPRTPSGVLDGGISLLRHRFGRFVGLAGLLLAPVWTFDLVMLATVGATNVDRTAVGPSALLLGSGASWAWIVVAANALVLSLLGVCIGHSVAARLAGHDPALRELLGVALRRIWAAAIVVVVASTLKVLAGTALPLVGFVLVDAGLFTASVVVGAERGGPFRSIGRAWRLTSGSFGRALGVVLGSLVVSQTLRLSFGFGPVVLVELLGGEQSLMAVVARLGSIVSVVVEPLTACIAAWAYLDHRCRREGLDLQRRRDVRFRPQARR